MDDNRPGPHGRLPRRQTHDAKPVHSALGLPNVPATRQASPQVSSSTPPLSCLSPQTQSTGIVPLERLCRPLPTSRGANPAAIQVAREATYRLSSQNTPDAFSDHRGLGLTHRYPVSLEPERSGSATPDFPGLGHLQRLPANPLSFVLTLIPRPGSQRPRNGSACRRREVHRSGLDRFHGNPGPFTDVDELLQLSASGVADQCAKQSPHRGPLREDRQVGAGTQVGSCLSTPRSRCRRTGQRPSSPASSPARGSLLPDEQRPARRPPGRR
jgi:hypothetical protein